MIVVNRNDWTMVWYHGMYVVIIGVIIPIDV